MTKSEVSQALQRIARGTGIVFIGTVISMFFGFLNRAIIARYFSTSEYGTFNLALTVLSVVLVIVTLGFQNSLPREIAFYKKRKPSRIKELISTAMIIVTLNSVVWMTILILGAEGISRIFNEDGLNLALKIMAFTLPFSALTTTVISVSHGFGRVREKVYFQNIAPPVAFLILILVGILMKFPFTYVFFAYVLSQTVTFLALSIDVRKVKLFEFRFLISLKIAKDLINFSIPLMLTGILGFIMNWTDTLMLGYYISSEVVGIYSAATPLARLITIVLASTSTIYTPIVTTLYAEEKTEAMRRVYQILTKWTFLITLPLFSAMLLFPETIISSLFGNRYVPAALALQILSLGFMFHTFLGLNGLSLIVIGDTNANLISNIFAAVFNIVLNIILIPVYGLDGAALATTISYFIVNILKSYWLYKKTGIHPFSRNYMKSLIISIVLLGLIKILYPKTGDILHVFFTLLLFMGSYFILILLSRSVDIEDIELMKTIEKKFHIPFLGKLLRLIERFVSFTN
ncbi:Polysaccharide biosynthesis related protein [Thermococcus onnurineus NA1]|uniref:Polysaccharide biosynthesis related protein n=1 Tax=Thermococcus onnurineus (strain NA1) TaxID=523850 RepID=B6YUW4_THEON|nr:flippase [Thermococcus onnurineus]ACJ17192.1 Polysaccharide biosynthesis related protein [Thermococcus onnurineus NA1]